ncbi:MAG: hypothetical protein EBZ48_05495 [Proteobacteria bacterium]|nr:hypothetical protein [Pseudomonadota bacterium]
MENKILLDFHGNIPELTQVIFNPRGSTPRTTVRGKTAGALKGAGTFQWTSAVRALSVIAVRAAISARTGAALTTAALSGMGGSLASTLDYAISKEPSWSCDMFGVDGNGRSLIRRMFVRTNSERKFPGPVVIGLNSAFLAPEQIIIRWDGALVSDVAQMDTLAQGLLPAVTEFVPEYSATKVAA